MENLKRRESRGSENIMISNFENISSSKHKIVQEHIGCYPCDESDKVST